MNEAELRNTLIDYYTNLQRIKKAETGVNPELDYQIRVTKGKLESMGVITSDLDL